MARATDTTARWLKYPTGIWLGFMTAVSAFTLFPLVDLVRGRISLSANSSSEQLFLLSLVVCPSLAGIIIVMSWQLFRSRRYLAATVLSLSSMLPIAGLAVWL